MKEEELKQLRKIVKGEQKEQLKLQKLMEEKSELEKNPDVRRYLELLIMDLDDKQTQNFAFASKKKLIRDNVISKGFDETNGIYVYLGTYRYDYYYDVEHGSSDISVKRNDSNADYSAYVDIEKDLINCVNVKIKDREQFEKTHNIIYPKKLFQLDFEREFFNLKTEFFKDAIEKGQKSAVTRVLKKCGR